jgi:tetratricopeptide (TPR) repeat protein
MRTPKLSALLLLATSLSIGVFSSGTAAAAGLPDAQALLDQGKWQEAATLAAGLKTVEGLSLAARATTYGAALLPDDQKRTQFEKAQELAKQAIGLNPNSADAHFELARADGRLAQYSGILKSLGLAGEVKRELDTAIRLNPKLAGAYVALGLWNAELTSKGFLATQATGASRAQINVNFQKAIALEPTTPVHRIEYANALVLQNNKPTATAQLQRAITLPANTFWEKRDLEAAKAKLASLK